LKHLLPSDALDLLEHCLLLPFGLEETKT